MPPTLKRSVLSLAAGALLPCGCVLVLVSSAALGVQSPFENFEGPQTQPVRLSSDGSRLYALNTPDARLSVFDLANPTQPQLLAEIPVGLEPVSVNPRTLDEVWVVNHLSDSVSVVSVSQGLVIDTLQVEDEPADVVFAGSPLRAFVSAAESNEIYVFDVATRALLSRIPVRGEQPRALAVRADGQRVYAAFALAGNRTTIVPRNAAPPQPPPTNPALPAPPQVGLIVDDADPAWAAAVPYTVLDNDVVEIDANALSVVRVFTRAGTTNLGLAVQPGTGALFLANTDALNLTRFEPNLRGHFVDNRVTRISVGATPVTTVFDLNPGLDYNLLPNPAALSTALAQPTALVFDPDGSRFYVAAFGTDRVGVVSPNGAVLARVEIGPATGANVDPRSKRGPRGLARHPSAERLYVLNRISNTLSVVDTQSLAVLGEQPVGSWDPTPLTIREGRGFLYDAKLSGNGTNSCASCHVDGEVDNLAWDLGDPAGSMQTVIDPNSGTAFNLHPMKGPMTTQSLRGLKGFEPFHWRGDRADLAAFNPAFDKLMGGSQLSSTDMQTFSDFVESVRLHPNPNLLLDRSFAPLVNGQSPAQGLISFTSVPSPTGAPFACSSCHSLPGQFVAMIRQQPGDPLPNKVPFMRGQYKKNNFSLNPLAQNVRGFGLEHDGSVAPAPQGTIDAFFSSFDTGTAPTVGATRTVTASNAQSPSLLADIAILEASAAIGDCDVVVKGRVEGLLMGLVYRPVTDDYTADRSDRGPYTWAQLQSFALAGDTFSVMGVPDGSGERIGIDRDLDGLLDGEELPHSYCTSSLTTNGCRPTLTASGSASASASSGFMLQVVDVEGAKQGLLFYGVSGAMAAPWAMGSSSWRCVAPPVQRMGLVNSGGTPGGCDGALALDWNAYASSHPSALGQPFQVGDAVHVQAWFRDPPAVGGTNLSDALEFHAGP